jgi:glycosyltransferase involved in cell wall biosynthesis
MKNNKNDILSICITVKNRSRVDWDGLTEPSLLLPNCIASIGEHFSVRDKVEIVISDWMSDDWPLREWMPKVCKNPYKIIDIDKKGFSKGYGVNVAVEHAMGDTVFLMDADMLLKSRRPIITGMSIVSSGGVYFPIPKYIVNMEGHFRYSCGVGNVVIDKQLFNDVGGMPEYYRFGFEDSDFYHILEEKGVKVMSKPTDDLIHPYHPQSLAFKERYIDDDPKNDEIIQKRVDVYRAMKDHNEKFTI